MKKVIIIKLMLMLMTYQVVGAVDSTGGKSIQQVESSIQDSALSQPVLYEGILDTLFNPVTMRKVFFPYERIDGNAVILETPEQKRDLPGIKSIRYRPVELDNWKFWVLMFSVLFLALIRLLNIRRFDELLLSTFDLNLNFKSYSDKTGNYFLSNFSLFINLILSVSLFWVTYLERHNKFEVPDFYLLFWKISAGIFVVYIVKVILNLVVGSLMNMRYLTVILLFNAVMVNNFLGIILVFLNLLYLYVPGKEAGTAFEAVVLITVFLSVIYRQIKNLWMGVVHGRQQFIYIFLYLCAFEILPWLIFFKLFLNGW